MLALPWDSNWENYLSYSSELLEKVVEMAEGIEVEDAPVFKTRDEIVRNQQ
ncbi:N-terminal-like protein CDKN2A-interacting protein, partial [Takifugu flavidus]